MSRIYFHSPSGTAELRGSERAYMGYLCAQMALAVFDPHEYGRAEVLGRVWQHPYPSAAKFPETFTTHVRIGGDRVPFTLPDSREADIFTVNLNTALALGNDAIRLCARLHGQCEIHAWVDGHNREWLAGVIEGGRSAGVLRADQGWEGVVSFLRARQDEPVVTSYAVTDSFPNRYSAVGTYGDEATEDAWHDLPREERWKTAMEGLRLRGDGLEMRPDCWTFQDFYFGRGDTAFSILETAYSLTPVNTEK